MVLHIKMFNTSLPRLVALCLCFAGLLAGCGGGGDEDVNALLKDTFSGSEPIKSGKLDIKLGIDLEGNQQVQGPIQLELTGPFQSQGTKRLPQFDFDAKLGAQGQSLSAGAVSTGAAGFLKVQGAAYTVDPRIFAQFKRGFETSQARQSAADKKNPTFATLGVDPRNWLKDATVEGDADVGGTETTRIKAGIDVPKLLTDVDRLLKRAGSLGAQNRNLPNSLTPQQRQQLARAVSDASFEVYTGKKDHILRRLVFKLKFDASATGRQGAAGAAGGTITFDLAIADLGAKQTIASPKDPKPFAELATALRSLGAAGGLGGLGGTAGGGQTTTPAPAAPATPGTPAAPASPAPPSGGTGSDAGDAYLQCLQGAGGDIAKAQECGNLLK